jgi:nitroimidazol reductase NimA-like FMN-containing flavoprotein (pyridoxamine 5'-phosphate oxidase superfamily)
MPIRTRTTVRRKPERGVYDAPTIEAILDAGFLCHAGFVEDGQPFVIPTLYARVENRLYLHGSPRSRILRPAEHGLPLCITVTHVDGLVLARSAFHHSINYRSVMILGVGRVVIDPEEKEAALAALVDHIVPGRSAVVRGPNTKELKATQVLAVSLDESSAKIRTGPPLDDDGDYSLPIWAGVLPLRQEAQEPIADPRLASDIPLPEHLRRYRPSTLPSS